MKMIVVKFWTTLDNVVKRNFRTALWNEMWNSQYKQINVFLTNIGSCQWCICALITFVYTLIIAHLKKSTTSIKLKLITEIVVGN